MEQKTRQPFHTRLLAMQWNSVPRVLRRRRDQGMGAQARCRSRMAVVTAAPKGILCDLDGVIYASGSFTVLPGARETFQYFRERQIPWLFVTNTNTKNREGLAARLQGLGIHCRAEDIVSPAKLAADWLRAHKTGPTALFVVPELSSEFSGVPLLPPSAESGAAAVVIGDKGLDWNYSELNRAFRLVMEGQLRMEAAGLAMTEPQCRTGNNNINHNDSISSSSSSSNNNNMNNSNGNSKAGEQQKQQQLQAAGSGGRVEGDGVAQNAPLTLISLGKGRYYKDTDGYSIDVGPFTAAIEFATDVKAVVLGKPDPLIFCLAAESLGLEPEEVVMIGDDVRGDVGGAQAAGLRGVLVRTGKFREHDLSVGITPDAVLPSIADLPSWWEQQRQQQGREDLDQETQQQEQQEGEEREQQERGQLWKEEEGRQQPMVLTAIRIQGGGESSGVAVAVGA